jgi:hypothetical protein
MNALLGMSPARRQARNPNVQSLALTVDELVNEHSSTIADDAVRRVWGRRSAKLIDHSSHDQTELVYNR